MNALIKISIFLYLIIRCFCGTVVETAELSNKACENFYEYACLNYKQQNPDPNYNNMLEKMNYEMNKKLLKYLRNTFMYNNYESNRQTYHDKLGLYYESCLRTNGKNLRKYFEEVTSGNQINWPLLEKREKWLSDNKTFNLWSLMGQLQSYGFNNVIVQQQIYRNPNNTLDIWLRTGVLDAETALPDTELLQKIMNYLGVEELETRILQLNASDLKWQELGEEYSEINETQELRYQDLAKAYPNLNLSLYLENLLGKEVLNINKITLDNPDYFEYLNQINWSKEDMEDLGSYLMLKYLIYLIQDKAEHSPLGCVEDLRGKFDLAVNFIVSEHFMKREYKQFELKLYEVLNKILETMSLQFEKNHLQLSTANIQELQKKLKGIIVNIGNLPLNKNYDFIENFYRDIPNLEADNYYRNHLLLLQHRFRQGLYYPQNHTHFIVTDSIRGSASSPFYVDSQNMVVIPFDNLRYPLFHYNQTPLQKFSLFGFLLAHELSHAFDTSGLLHDEQGLPSNTTSEIVEQSNFVQSIECMQQQEPTDYIDERLADFFGIRAAYGTYSKYYGKGLTNWQQEFFVNLAQYFCEKYNNATSITHDADELRLNQIVKNYEEFSKAFGCAETDPLNSKQRCRVY